MYAILSVIVAVGCLVMAGIFSKSSDNDWGSVLMSLLFAGSAGVLISTLTD